MKSKTPQHEEPTIPVPDTTPPGEETQEIFPDAPLEEDDEQLEGEGGNGGEKYDGGEIPSVPVDAEPVE